MARSRRKTPIVGITTAPSEKEDKQAANRRLRRSTRRKLSSGADAACLPEKRDAGNVWAMAKDGKQYLQKPTQKDLRK
ncbi:MAG: hypothetical protein KDD69_13180 [Bdellovibrionales bacterium]|nr:hypothetical protein [Bdellovibrionales bacterium]